MFSSHHSIVDHLKRRWPLWQKMRIRSEDSQYDFPPLMALSLCAIEEPDKSPVCFVLPRKGDACRWASVIAGLWHAQQIFPSCNEQRIRHCYQEGEEVQLFPSGHSFEFEGIKPGPSGDRFHLCSYDRRLKASFPVSEMARLHTIGHAQVTRSTVRSPRTGPDDELDQLLDIRTYGNHRMFRNRVLVIDSRTGFNSFARQSCVCLDGKIGRTFNVAKTLPHELIRSHWIKDNPLSLVAVTSSDEIAAKAAKNSRDLPLTIFANGLSYFRNLQTFEELTHGHKLIIFAEESEMQGERARVLADNGCRFWWLRDDITLLETDADDALWVHQWASLRQHLKIEAVSCKAPHISDAARELKSLFSEIGREISEEMRKFNGKVWQLLLEASLWTGRPRTNKLKHFHERLDKRYLELEEAKHWIPQPAVEVFQKALHHLKCYSISEFAPGASKASGLLTTAQTATSKRQRVAVLVGDESQATSVRAMLKQRNIHVEAHTKTVPDGTEYDHVICVGWTNRFAMRELVDGCASPRLSILSFDYEKSWIDGFVERLECRPQSIQQISAAAKAKMVANNSASEWSWPTNAGEPSVAQQEFNTTALDDWFAELEIIQPRKGGKPRQVGALAENEVHALFVNFIGDGYAYFTSSRGVPCLVIPDDNEPYRVTEKKPGTLQPGDWVIFPQTETAGKIAQVADAITGDPAFIHRTRARQWRLALEEIAKKGFSVNQICKYANAYNHPLNAATLRIWLREDSDQIGPATKADLEVIGKIARDVGVTSPNILTSLDVVWTAIQALRGAHISAGSQINDVLLKRIPSAVSDLEDTGTTVHLGSLGSALLVKIERVGDLSEACPRNSVNFYLEN